jgi:hypothetical protein
MTPSLRFRFALLIAGTAGAVLFTEIVLTRLFSVLLFRVLLTRDTPSWPTDLLPAR